jgi:Putative beta barrel porin-7 (BBP7)
MGLEEDLGVTQTTNVLAGGNVGFRGELVSAGSTVNVIDRIQTRNDFYGGQVGLQKEAQWHRVFVCTAFKVAIGQTHETVNTFGTSTLLRSDGTTATAAGGLLAVPGTSLLKSLNPITYIPEFNLTVGYDITPHIRVSAGYTFLYWSDVVRPGVQFNRVVNSAVVPTSLEFGSSVTPMLATGPTFRHSDFWAQGVSFGVAFRY